MNNLSRREQVWLTAWAAVARAENCRESSSAKVWADKCLEAFDATFPPPKDF